MQTYPQTGGLLILRGVIVAKRPFSKPPTTYEEQVFLLQKRGMMIDDVETACFFLQHINLVSASVFHVAFYIQL